MKTFNFFLLALLFAFVVGCDNSASKTATTEEPKDQVEEASVEVATLPNWEEQAPKAAISEEGMAADAPEAIVLPVNTAASKLSWKGSKVAYFHHGVVKLTEGELRVENGDLVAGFVDIDMGSIETVDLADNADKKGKLEGHLKSEDFFNVAQHPTANLVLTEVIKEQGDTYSVSANLTIKDITHQINFPATISVSEEAITAKAFFSIDRSKWDVRYGSGSFFEDLGDKLIADDIVIDLDLRAGGSAI